MNDRTPHPLLIDTLLAELREAHAADAHPDSPGAARDGATEDKRPSLTMDDYDQIVRRIEPSMRVVFSNADTRTFWSEHAVERVRRVKGPDQKIYEVREQAILGAQIQAYRDSHARGFRIRWFYPSTAQ